jgi:hypothetical protein
LANLGLARLPNGSFLAQYWNGAGIREVLPSRVKADTVKAPLRFEFRFPTIVRLYVYGIDGIALPSILTRPLH